MTDRSCNRLLRRAVLSQYRDFFPSMTDPMRVMANMRLNWTNPSATHQMVVDEAHYTKAPLTKRDGQFPMSWYACTFAQKVVVYALFNETFRRSPDPLEYCRRLRTCDFNWRRYWRRPRANDYRHASSPGLKTVPDRLTALMLVANESPNLDAYIINCKWWANAYRKTLAFANYRLLLEAFMPDKPVFVRSNGEELRHAYRSRIDREAPEEGGEEGGAALFPDFEQGAVDRSTALGLTAAYVELFGGHNSRELYKELPQWFDAFVTAKSKEYAAYDRRLRLSRPIDKRKLGKPTSLRESTSL